MLTCKGILVSGITIIECGQEPSMVVGYKDGERVTFCDECFERAIPTLASDQNAAYVMGLSRANMGPLVTL